MSIQDNKVSINPFSKKEYLLPKKLDDKEKIDEFLKKHKEKKIIVIQGLGSVGAIMATVCANAITEDYAVIGVDLPNEENYWKVQSINEGIFPIAAEDKKIEKYFRQALNQDNFYATYDQYAYSQANVVIVDINLDVQINYARQREILNYDVDVSSFKNAIKSVAENCREDVLVLVETTVPPGICEQIVHPILKEGLKKRGLSLDKFKLGHSPERVMPGPDYIDSIQNFFRVYSGINEESADATENFLHTIINTDKYPLTRLSSTNASEISKVLENSYRAMNIAFIAEWSRFAEKSGVNLYEVIDAIRMRPTHSNIMYPGIGVGGYCLTKDPLLASWSMQEIFNSDLNLAQSEMSVSVNNQMPTYAFDFLNSIFSKETLGNNVLLLGVSYRGDVGDTRSSPVDLFYQCCIDSNFNVSLHDPYVSFWEEKQVNVSNDINKILTKNYDLVVISTGHSLYKTKEFINHLMAVKPKIVFDTLGIFSEEDIDKLKQVSEVCILGRGNY